MAKADMTTYEVAHSQECIALGAKKACQRVSELRLLEAYRMLALYQRHDIQVAPLVASCLRAILVASCLWAILTGSQGLDLAGSASCSPLSLPYRMHH